MNVPPAENLSLLSKAQAHSDGHDVSAAWQVEGVKTWQARKLRDVRWSFGRVDVVFVIENMIAQSGRAEYI